MGNFLLLLQFGAGVKLPFITPSVYSCCALNSDRETGDNFKVTLDNSNLPVGMGIPPSWCKLHSHLFDRPHMIQSSSAKEVFQLVVRFILLNLDKINYFCIGQFLQLLLET